MACELQRQSHSMTFWLQVSYKLVFVMEYLGPLLIYPFFWTSLGRSLLHGVSKETHPTVLTQDLALFYWSFHYAKVSFHLIHGCYGWCLKGC